MKVKTTPIVEYGPWTNCIESLEGIDVQIGQAAIAEGRVAVIVLAGGQGTRFDPKKLKGMTELTLFKKKSLFQVLCERVQMASKRANRPLWIAFMTAPDNHTRTIDFFREHNFFGLNSGQVAFFPQTERELLDENEQPFLAGPDKPAKGPDGNGALFRAMQQSKLADKWKVEGIETVQILPIDNPLAIPYDPLSIAVHRQKKVDATVLVSKKRDPHEYLGSLVEAKGHLHIVEYSEVPQERQEAKDENGEFVYRYMNLGLLIFSLDFMRKVATKELPYHVARKRSSRLVDGKIIFPEEAFAYKFEQFIFDSFLYSKKVQALLVDRDRWYAPLKNLSGEHSIDSVQSAFLARDRQVYKEVTGTALPKGARFELSQEFYYPTDEFLKKWRGRKLPQEGYIE